MSEVEFSVKRIVPKYTPVRPRRSGFILSGVCFVCILVVWQQLSRMTENENMRDVLGVWSAQVISPLAEIPPVDNSVAGVLAQKDTDKNLRQTPAEHPEVSTTPTASPVVQATSSPNNSPDIITPNPSQTVRTYQGPPFPKAASKKELFKHDFEGNEVSGWQKTSENGEIVAGKRGNGMQIGPRKAVFTGGESDAHAGTLAFWLRLDTAKIDYGEVPIVNWNYKGEDQPPFSLFEISYVHVDTRLYFSIYDETGDQYDVSSVLSNPADWHYIVVTWDLTSAPFRRVLYIDGTKVAEDDFPFAPETVASSTLELGDTLGDRSRGEFVLDELSFLNWAKNEVEIAESYRYFQ